MQPVHIGSTPMCSPRQTCSLCTLAQRPCVVPGRLELPTSTLSVWRSNQLSYRTGIASGRADWNVWGSKEHKQKEFLSISIMQRTTIGLTKKLQNLSSSRKEVFQPHLPVRLPCYDLAPITCFTLGRSSFARVTDFRRPRLSWLDGRCVQGPGTYSPRHG